MNPLVRAPLAGEVLPPGELLCVTAAMHPMKGEHRFVFVPVGASIAEIVERCGQECGASRLSGGAAVTLAGEPVPRPLWRRLRPKAGVNIVVRAVPGKGFGGIIKSILSIALVVVATAVFGPAGLALSSAWTAAAVGVVSLVGSFVLNALFPPASTSTGKPKQIYSIGGAKNEIAKWGPIPSLLGETRIAPKYAAGPYTEFAGESNQYVRMLLVWGLGPMDIGEIKFGETPISEYDDVEVQTFEGYASDGQQTLYPGEVVQEDFQVDVSRKYSPYFRYTADDAAEVLVDYIAPAGIYNLTKSSGKRKKLTVEGLIQLRNPDTNEIVASQPWKLSAKSVDPIRRSARFAGLPGDRQYEVVFSRSTEDYDDDDDDDKIDTVTWTAVRTVRNSPPIEYGKPLAITAIRIKATKQLNGVPDEVNAVCCSKAKSWNGSAWLDDRPTRNPADLFRLVLQGPGNARPVSDWRIDLPTVERWADYCRDKGFTFDMYRDFQSSVRETLRDVCAAGRAVPLFRDGKWSVAWEEDAAPIVQHFTPRNSRDFSWTRRYLALPHGLRVKFKNRKRKWIEDEKLVFDDGFTKANATLFEQAEFPGVEDPDLIFKHGRYRIADAKLRPTTYRMTVDFEHLVCTRGDRVRVAHDVIPVGLHNGRIKAVSGTNVTLDEAVFMEAGKTYGMTIRRKNGSSVVRTVATVPGWHDTVSLSASGAEVGALFMFGHPNEQTDVMRIMAIRPGDDLSAEIELVDDAPGIQDADTGPITGDDGTVVPPNIIARPVMEGLSAYINGSSGAYQIVVDYPRIAGAKRYIADISYDQGDNWTTVYSGEDTYWSVPVEKDALLLRAAAFGPIEMGPWKTIEVTLAEFPGREIDPADLLPAVRDLLEFGRDGLADVEARLQALATTVGLSTAQQIIDVGGVSARLIDEQTVRQTADEAVARRVTGVETGFANVQTGFAAVSAATQVLESRTKATEDGLVSTASAVTGAVARLDAVDTKNAGQDATIAAQAGAISALDAEVEQQGSVITAQGTAITGVNARVGQVDAGGLLKIEARANNSGQGTVRMALMGRVATAQGFKEVGLFFDVDNDKGLVSLVGDKVALGNGETLAYFSGGRLIAETVTAREVKARVLSGDKLVLGGVDYTELAQNAVSSGVSGQADGDINLTINAPTGRIRVDVFARFKAVEPVGSSSGEVSRSFTLYRDGASLQSFALASQTITYSYRMNQTDETRRATTDSCYALTFEDSPAAGTHTYELRSTGGSGAVKASLGLLNLKR